MIGPKAYIHLSRLEQNIANIQRAVGDRILMVVVKANGYGHGSLNIAKHISENSDIIFCVFTIDEAMILRQGGIKNPILIFSRIQKEWIELARDYDLWINACDLDDLKLIAKIFKKKSDCPSIHLKFDTGMTRLGFDHKENESIFKYLLNNPQLDIQGIYSHFATADEGDLSYAEYQLKIFNKILNNGEKLGFKFKFIHCSNSGALLNLPTSLFNTVRVGMLAYGIAPSNEVEMKIDVDPVMSFCGPIVNLRRVGPNTQVSYGGVYSTKRMTTIGVIQTGFADGFPRPWYDNGYVSYKGKYYNIAGRVCMDQFMVDFGDSRPNLGDEVLIFGKKDNDELSVELIANNINSTTYVLLTAIQGRTEHILL
jgi:alanine racemase